MTEGDLTARVVETIVHTMKEPNKAMGVAAAVGVSHLK